MPLTIDTIREHCLRKPGKITEEFPFGGDVLVFKVHGKLFLLTQLEQRPLTINLKCEPALAVELRERYDSVQPGYHMNKKYWNTVALNDSIPWKEVLHMIDHSYEQVVHGLPKGVRSRMEKAGVKGRQK